MPPLFCQIRGDLCWRDLTCMNYHYETQPVPGPLSRWATPPHLIFTSRLYSTIALLCLDTSHAGTAAHQDLEITAT